MSFTLYKTYKPGWFIKRRLLNYVFNDRNGKFLYEKSLALSAPPRSVITKGSYNNEISSRQEIIEKLIPYVKNEVKKGTRLNQIMRHTLGLFHGQTGSNFWKRYLSENLCVRDADVKKIDHIMDKVKLAPQARLVG